jgi:hypothetical protein
MKSLLSTTADIPPPSSSSTLKKSNLQFMEVVSQATQGRKRRTAVLESALKKRKT